MDFKEYVSFLNSDLTVLKGVGDKKSALFAKIGVHNVWDLIYNFPRDYEDRRAFKKIGQLVSGDMCCILVTPIKKLAEKRIKRNISLFSLILDDGTGIINAKWFSSPKYRQNIDYGEPYVFYGRCIYGYDRLEFEVKSMEKYGKGTGTGVILPVYRLVSGLSQTAVRLAVGEALKGIDRLKDALPDYIVNRYGLFDIDTAVRTLHNPSDIENLSKARARLAFEELFVLQLSLMFLKNRRTSYDGIVFKNVKCAEDMNNIFPFELTDGQKSAVRDICRDFKSGRCMNRLLQGDVGSGKTAVAACAMYVAYKNGFQSAIMAPTEILAVQHYNTLTKFFGEYGIKIALLTGGAKGKKQTLEDIKEGRYDIVVGTHALIEGKVEFKSLGLCITDEQHRFGVNQRAKLSQKGTQPHVLVMSATPIPRTLSLILYGDLDISFIKSLPKGRQSIDTFCVNTSYHERLYDFVKKQLDDGGQCYVVCPLVEQSDSLDVQSGTELEEYLRLEVFSDYRVDLLHGKMKPQQKDEVMEKFKNHETDLLVSTTVIEVGVDVPNANIMVIENAERFGLSQLHQLRGRVGRGTRKSYCVLVTDSKSEETKQRMDIMCATNDGFLVAQKDLELRGCGEFFGTRQHGLPELKVANLFTDTEVLVMAKEASENVLDTDPNLESDDISLVRGRIQKLYAQYENFNIFN